MGALIAALVLAQPAEPEATTTEVDVVFTSVGCLDSGNNMMSLFRVLAEHLDENPGELVGARVGEAGLSNGLRYLFPASDMTDIDAPRQLLADVSGYSREVVVEALPVLDSPNEMLLQLPLRADNDWLRVVEDKIADEGTFPNVRRVVAALVRYQRPGRSPVYVLEMSGAPGELEGDLWRYIPEYAANATIEAGERSARIFMLGKEIGRGSRVRAEWNALVSSAAPTLLKLHPGNVTESSSTPEVQAFCARSVADLELDAIVPRTGELSLGPGELYAMAGEYDLPYIAANLTLAGDEDNGKAPLFPRFVLIAAEEVTIGVVGLVGPSQLEGLSASVRSQWRLTDATVALDESIAEMRRMVGRPPDFLVMLAATAALRSEMPGSGGVDLVVGAFGGSDMRRIERRARVAEDSPVYASREEQPLLVGRASSASVGTARARFELRAEKRPFLREVEQSAQVVLEPGPMDTGLERALREIEESRIYRSAEVLLPDATAVLEADAALQPLVWGERIYHRGRMIAYDRAYPARFSDPLWFRFVTNALRDASGADVALIRSLPMTSTSIGVVQRWLLNDWLQTQDAVRTVEISGSSILEIAARLRRQDASTATVIKDYLAQVGIDTRTSKVGGRAINAGEKYRLITTDSGWAAIQDLTPELTGLTPVRALGTRGGRIEPEDEASELLLRDAVLDHIAAFGDGVPLGRLLRDPSGVRSPRWTFHLRELSAGASIYSNTAGIDAYAATRETRLTTPNNFALGGKTDAYLEYDDARLAWELRLKAAYNRLEFEEDGAQPQEQADDLVVSTELRANAIELSIADTGFSMVPFLKLAFDTEFTPTPDPANPDLHLAHQKVGRASLGLVLYPGGVFRELRVGGVYESDFSDSQNVRHEGGLEAGYDLSWAITSFLTFTSDFDLRYFVPTDRDDETDLGLVITADNKLSVPLVGNLSVFIFADLFVAQGKVPATERVVMSVVSGAGLQFSALVR